MKKICIWLSAAIVLTSITFSTMRLSVKASDMKDQSEKELRVYANENNTWVLCYQQGKRTGDFFQFDATAECLYFSYFEHSCVDVYDINGIFLYSFIFPDRQNGGVCVRCEDNNTYISTKDNILYIFNGIEEIDCMDYDEAAKKGFDFFWFYNNEPHITVDNNYICWLNANGEIENKIDTPTVIRETIPDTGVTGLFKLFYNALAILLIPLIKYISRKKTK